MLTNEMSGRRFRMTCHPPSFGSRSLSYFCPREDHYVLLDSLPETRLPLRPGDRGPAVRQASTRSGAARSYCSVSDAGPNEGDVVDDAGTQHAYDGGHGRGHDGYGRHDDGHDGHARRHDD